MRNQPFQHGVHGWEFAKPSHPGSLLRGPYEIAAVVAKDWARAVHCEVATRPASSRAGHGSVVAVPCMPCTEVPMPSTDPNEPIRKLTHALACVAKVLTKAEIKSDPDAQKAMDAEYYKLQKNGTWDLTRVRPRRDVADEARKA